MKIGTENIRDLRSGSCLMSHLNVCRLMTNNVSIEGSAHETKFFACSAYERAIEGPPRFPFPIAVAATAASQSKPVFQNLVPVFAAIRPHPNHFLTRGRYRLHFFGDLLATLIVIEPEYNVCRWVQLLHGATQ